VSAILNKLEVEPSSDASDPKTPSINKIFFESLKKSKYWINL